METFYSIELGCWITVIDGVSVGTAETEAEALNALDWLVPAEDEAA